MIRTATEIKIEGIETEMIRIATETVAIIGKETIAEIEIEAPAVAAMTETMKKPLPPATKALERSETLEEKTTQPTTHPTSLVL